MTKICPISYELIDDELRYSRSGLNNLSPKLSNLDVLALSSCALRQEAALRADKMSIQGVQPKLSARLDITQGKFQIVDSGGNYILKPQHEIFDQAPENEDLTMRMASLLKINVPVHGLVYTQDKAFCYFIKRFDRHGKNKKYAVEDFAQLSGQDRETKYQYSMEKLVPIIDTYTTFPMIEKADFLKRVLFNFVVGNEDMHLKNFSIISIKSRITLAPAYDFINSTLILKKTKEELALSLNGRKRNFRRKDFIDYYAKKRLKLPDKIIEQQLQSIYDAVPFWLVLIKKSFLTTENKAAYEEIVLERLRTLKLID